MKRLLVAALALVSFAGIAAAQQAPFLSGNYSANVAEANSQNPATERVSGVDYRATASVTKTPAAGDGGLVSAQTRDEARSGQ